MIDAILPRGSNARRRVRDFAISLRMPAPKAFQARFRHIDADQVATFSEFVIANYIHPLDYWATPAGKDDLAQHTEARLKHFRSTLVPWFAKHISLVDARVLEIGCGTGASTQALAEQGACVLGVDIEEASLRIARKRCEMYGISGVEFLHGDAATALSSIDLSKFDLIIFWAVLEHMTHDERLEAINAAWKGLRPGAIIGVVDTPNRLWHFDPHTSNQPFFHWLPEEIARRYTKHCDRALIQDIHALPREEGLTTLQRWGRGISFHDFDIAIGGLAGFQIFASYGPYERARFIPRLLKWHLSNDRAYNRLLRKFAPKIHPAFFEPYLDFLAKK